MFISWKPGRRKYFAYLQHNFWDRGKVRTSLVYLGADAQRAEAKLKRIGLGEADTERLRAELYRKRPDCPPPVNAEEKAAAQLKRIAGRYPKSEKVREAVNAALAILEGGEHGGRNDRGKKNGGKA